MPLSPLDKRLSELEAKWLNGSISAEEAAEYARWYNEEQDAMIEVPLLIAASKENHRNKILHAIDAKRVKTIPVKKRVYRYAAAAIIIMVLLSAGIYMAHSSGDAALPAPLVRNPHFKNDVLPGSNKAILVLSNGKTIVLDSARQGMLAEQGSATISNISGCLTYASTGSGNALLFNTLKTGRGEQYPVTLSDGSRVWLNAASSLRYPVAFGGNERKVELTGEAYFEVTKDVARPFRVVANNTLTEVLGTHFNINAYPDERYTKTTLLEGAVKLNNTMLLKPGQESVAEKNGTLTLIADADLEQAVAWKNGLFQFKSSDIGTVLRQIEKWYDIKIEFEGNKTTDKFTGKIDRRHTLTELLTILEYSKVHFKLEGKKLTVLP
jgi:ferric-dicitrate binding protein FerR (iron transport regulator)